MKNLFRTIAIIVLAAAMMTGATTYSKAEITGFSRIQMTEKRERAERICLMEEMSTKNKKTAYTANTAVLRGGIGYGCSKTAIIPENAQIAVYGERNGFSYVSYGETYGWIKSENIIDYRMGTKQEEEPEMASEKKIHYSSSFMSTYLRQMRKYDGNNSIIESTKARMSDKQMMPGTDDYVFYKEIAGTYTMDDIDFRSSSDTMTANEFVHLYYLDSGITINLTQDTKAYWFKASEKTYRNLKALDAYLNRIVRSITNKNMTEMEALRAIYDYTKDNLEYQNEEESKRLKGLDTVLTTGSSICEDYALLIFELGTRCGLDISYVRGNTDFGLHAWNSVVIDGTTYYLDATNYDDTSTSDYFLFSDDTFNGTENMRTIDFTMGR